MLLVIFLDLLIVSCGGSFTNVVDSSTPLTLRSE